MPVKEQLFDPPTLQDLKCLTSNAQADAKASKKSYCELTESQYGANMENHGTDDSLQWSSKVTTIHLTR